MNNYQYKWNFSKRIKSNFGNIVENYIVFLLISTNKKNCTSMSRKKTPA